MSTYSIVINATKRWKAIHGSVAYHAVRSISQHMIYAVNAMRRITVQVMSMTKTASKKHVRV
jgi:hypothetical protein